MKGRAKEGGKSEEEEFSSERQGEVAVGGGHDRGRAKMQSR